MFYQKGQGGHLDHMIRTIRTNFNSMSHGGPARNSGSDRPTGFGERVWKVWMTELRKPVYTIHVSLSMSLTTQVTQTEQ